jgi:hypothetical protein
MPDASRTSASNAEVTEESWISTSAGDLSRGRDRSSRRNTGVTDGATALILRKRSSWKGSIIADEEVVVAERA